MNIITSRKNSYIQHVRALQSDSGLRYSCGEYICIGYKNLTEALSSGAEILSVLWKNEAQAAALPETVEQYSCPGELFDYASFQENSPGPLFTVRIHFDDGRADLSNAIVLENVQDPGNVGTVIRTADAFGIDAVFLVGACADLYNPKTVRASMGTIFRQRVIKTDIQSLASLLKSRGIPLYAAALDRTSSDIRDIDLLNSAVAVGSEGHGLSGELLGVCDGSVIIPMSERTESLNAAVASAVIMWEINGRRR